MSEIEILSTVVAFLIGFVAYQFFAVVRLKKAINETRIALDLSGRALLRMHQINSDRITACNDDVEKIKTEILFQKVGGSKGAGDE